MSRIGRKPISFCKSIDVSMIGSTLKVIGTEGQLTMQISHLISLQIEESRIFISVGKKDKASNAIWGLTRSLIFNMIKGVNKPFSKKLTLVGPGYKAMLHDRYLILHLGYSHEIIFTYPRSVKIKCLTENVLEVLGCDKQIVSQIAAEIRSLRSPDVYKGRGIRYDDEIIVTKKGKESKK